MMRSISSIVVAEVVVDQHVVGELEPDRLLGLGLAQPGDHLLLAVAALAQPALLLRPGRRQDEDQDGVGLHALHLLGAVDLDLEHDTSLPPARLGQRRAVEVAEELGPLEEAALVDVAHGTARA